MSFQLLPHTISNLCWHEQPDLDLANEAFSLLAQLWEARHKPLLETGQPTNPRLSYLLTEFDAVMREASPSMERALVEWEKQKG